MQSFLGSLNYYSRFIEDFAIYASALYELREVNFVEVSSSGEITSDDMKVVDPKWIRAKTAFTILKDKMVTAPVLRHFNPDLTPVIIVYASEWAIAAALMQDHEGVYEPVMFTSRILKSNEINYGIVEKEVLPLLRSLDVCYTMLLGRPIRILTRFSTLAWLLRSSGFQGRLEQWAAILSPWTLEVMKCVKGEDEILGVIAASITPRSEVDEILISISPRKQPKSTISLPPPTVDPGEKLLVVSFDGSARVKHGGGAFSAIVWSLPEWTVIAAASEYADDLTVNEAEYRGLLLSFDLLKKLDKGRLVICGDSNLIVRQMRGEIDCKAPGLKILRQKAMDLLRIWPDHEILHVKRDWNQSADSLAGAALKAQTGTVVTSDLARQDLITLNRLNEVLVPRSNDALVRVSAVTMRSRSVRTRDPEGMNEEVMQRLRLTRILQAQDEESWITCLKKYLRGDVRNLTSVEAKRCSNLAEDYAIDKDGILLYCPPSAKVDPDRDTLMRLVMADTLHEDVLHHYHTSLEGGHQGIGRTYQRILKHFHWRGLYRSVQRYVGNCTDYETGKGRPTIRGESPRNLQTTYPFQIIAVDHIPSLPKSFNNNTELLIWVDLLTGYVIAKVSASRTAQTIAESYEKCVFRRFGASEAIRHDREPGFMSDFFRAFNKIIGQRQRATMASPSEWHRGANGADLDQGV